MKKEMFKKLTALAVCGIMLVLPVVSFAADGFITPWNSTSDFKNTVLDVKAPASYSSNWISAYNFVGVNAGATVIARDGYEKDGETVYDGVSAIQGDKYLYYNSAGLKNSQGKIMSPGSLYVNYSLFSNDKLNATKANGGICHGKVTYEFDVRIGELDAEGDYSTDTGVFIYGYNAGGATDTDKYKRLVALPFKHNASQTSYYTSYTEVGASSATSPGLALNEWYHYTIAVDVNSGTADIDITCKNPTSTIPANLKQSASGTISLAATGIPAFTTIKIVPAKGGATSIDNVSVTKETYVIGAKEIAVDNNNNITATVKIANDVYTDKTVGDAVNTVSPNVILALYDGNNALIDAEMKSITFEGHSVTASETSQAFFTKDLDYKDVTVTLPKTDDVINAKVFVWNNMTDMFPYTVGDDLNGSSN